MTEKEDALGRSVSDIATKYCDFLHECYPLPQGDSLRDGQIAEVVEFLEKEGRRGADQLMFGISVFKSQMRDNLAVQELAKSLTEDLRHYKKMMQTKAPRQKTGRKKMQER